MGEKRCKDARELPDTTYNESTSAARPSDRVRDEGATTRIFWIFATVHVAFWTLIPSIMQPNRPLDLIEMLYWGHSFQWGYYKHPPLPAWIAEAVFHMSAGATWPLYLVGQLAMAGCFWAAWQLGKHFLQPWQALCGCMLLEACSYYTLTTADINNSIILQPLWALATLSLYRALITERLRWWAATGVCLGLGMLSKYDIATLAVAMLALPVVNSKARLALRTMGPYLTLCVSLLIFAPHVVWMFENNFPTVRYIFFRAENSRSWIGHLANPIEYLLSQGVALLPMFVVAYPLWRTAKARDTAHVDSDNLDRDFLIVVCFGPFAIDLLVSLAMGVQVQSMWGAPLWTFIGLVLLVYAGSRATPEICKKVVLRSAVAGVIMILALMARTQVLPHFRGKPSRIHFPGDQLSQAVEQEWTRHCDGPLSVVTGTWWPAANVGLGIAGPAQIYDFIVPQRSPWCGDRDLRQLGGVIVWEIDAGSAECEEQVHLRFPEAEILPPLELRWQTTAAFPPVRFFMAIVRPSDLASRASSPR